MGHIRLRTWWADGGGGISGRRWRGRGEIARQVAVIITVK